MPHGISPELSEALRAAVRDVAATSSAWRPEVAAYLFDHALAPLYARLVTAGEGDPVLIAGVWRLMLASVATRRCGVSTDDWQRAEDYPDRYFPTLWLNIVPSLVPASPPGERLARVSALFNLGENLPARQRAAANAVAARLAAAGGDLAADFEGCVGRALADLGIIDAERGAPSSWRRMMPRPPFDCAAVDPGFLPDAVAIAEGRRVVVVDRRRGTALHLDAAGPALVCVGQGAAPPAIEPRRSVKLGAVELRLDGRAVMARVGQRTRRLGRIEAIAPAALGVGPDGDLVIVDAASAHVQWWRAEG